jgi:eukaryotic-like serine/threonine-protein kinase
MARSDDHVTDEQEVADGGSSAPSAGSSAAVSDSGAPEAARLLPSGMGSGLLAQQPTPSADETIAVAKVCPQCGVEYETGSRFCPKDGSPLRPKAEGDPLVGRVIADRYLVLARLGEGGMGRVYLCEHVKMNRQCAIKVMNPSLVNDSESSARFAREASSAARILHQNVAAVFDYGEADKIVYLVMEYVDGEPLSTILARDGALDPRRAIDIARQIADGLSAAHELGIVHRDLKPDNVIVARSRAGKEIPKVVDFGIAKAVSESPQDALTRSGLVIGTPEYMSPEQLLGDPVDARADIYSLGCILFQMLTGQQAFDAESREQMIRRRLHEAPPHVRDVLPDLPRRLDTLIAHMLARSPGDRLASAAEARDGLDPALALGGWDPQSITAPRRATGGVPAAADPAADVALQPTMPLRRQRMKPAGIAMGAVLGVAILGGGVALWSHNAPAPQTNVPAPATPSPTGTAAKNRQVTDSVRSPVASSTSPSMAAHPDSSRPKASAAERSTKTAESSTDRPPAKTPAIPREITAPLEKFTRAIKSEDIANVEEAYRSISPKMVDSYSRQIFQPTSIISAHSTFENLSVDGDRAVLLYTVTLKFNYKNTGQTGSQNQMQLRYRATLAKRDKKWVIQELANQT